LAVVAAADIVIEALFVGILLVRPEVPLSDVAGGVASRLQSLGDRNLFELHPQSIGRAQQLFVSSTDVFGRVLLVGGDPAALESRPDPVRNAQSGRVTTRHHSSTRRRADSARGIGVSETHTFGGELVDIRRLIVLAAVTAGVFPA